MLGRFVSGSLNSPRQEWIGFTSGKLAPKHNGLSSGQIGQGSPFSVSNSSMADPLHSLALSATL